MHTTLDHVWICYDPTTKIGHYSVNGKPNNPPERDPNKDFYVYYGDDEDVKDSKGACEKARELLREMGATEIKPITSSHL